MTPMRVYAARRFARVETVAAAQHCEWVFAAARGIPRQGMLRAALTAARLARAAGRATPGSGS